MLPSWTLNRLAFVITFDDKVQKKIDVVNSSNASRIAWFFLVGLWSCPQNVFQLLILGGKGESGPGDQSARLTHPLLKPPGYLQLPEQHGFTPTDSAAIPHFPHLPLAFLSVAFNLCHSHPLFSLQQQENN